MKKSLAIALPLGLLVSACAASPPPVANSAPAAPASPAPQVTESTPSRGNIQVAPDILKACGLPDADAYFAFDSSHVTSKDVTPLNAIATCFKTGPLEGRSLKLVGRADPRGASEYNMTLGQSRADSVEGYLANKGLDKNRMETTSRGAMDAVGSSESDWARDRRVDVMLGN
jgi:peptidoglycan-associated lipoprotein